MRVIWQDRRSIVRDAVPALLRAPQAVIAGDRRQLPPTTFFDAAVDDEVGEDDGGLTVGFESILDVLDTDPDIVDAPDAEELPPARGELALHDVSFSYATGGQVLHDVDLHVDAGTTLALVGETGAGKTTIAELVAPELERRDRVGRRAVGEERMDDAGRGRPRHVAERRRVDGRLAPPDHGQPLRRRPGRARWPARAWRPPRHRRSFWAIGWPPKNARPRRCR